MNRFCRCIVVALAALVAYSNPVHAGRYALTTTLANAPSPSGPPSPPTLTSTKIDSIGGMNVGGPGALVELSSEDADHFEIACTGPPVVACPEQTYADGRNDVADEHATTVLESIAEASSGYDAYTEKSASNENVTDTLEKIAKVTSGYGSSSYDAETVSSAKALIEAISKASSGYGASTAISSDSGNYVEDSNASLSSENDCPADSLPAVPDVKKTEIVAFGISDNCSARACRGCLCGEYVPLTF